VEKEQLPRALAVRQAGGQVASLLGAPLGGVLVASAGLPGAALVDAATFAVVLVVLLRVRPAFDVERSPRGEGLLAGAAGGVRLAVTDPVLRPALLLTAAAAAFLLPVVSLLNPLLAREHGWGAGAAGLMAAGQSAGMIAVSLAVTRRGAMRRIGVGAAAGLIAAALGIAAVAAAPTPVAAAAGALLLGAGSGMFACHIGPLVLTGIPETHLSRMQSLLTLVQSVSLLAANPLLGTLADTTSPRVTTGLCAAAVSAAALTALTSHPLRTLHGGQPGPGRRE
jgi:predicted MFS family arabinose efflux permease